MKEQLSHDEEIMVDKCITLEDSVEVIFPEDTTNWDKHKFQFLGTFQENVNGVEKTVGRFYNCSKCNTTEFIKYFHKKNTENSRCIPHSEPERLFGFKDGEFYEESH